MRSPVCGFNENTSFAHSEITRYEISAFAPMSESLAFTTPILWPLAAFSGISNEYAAFENVGGLSLVSAT